MAIIVITTSAANINLQFREVESLKKKQKNRMPVFCILYCTNAVMAATLTRHPSLCKVSVPISDASIVNQNLH